MKAVTPLITLDTLKLAYFSYLHSILSHWPIFWENSAVRNKALNIQSQIIKQWQVIKTESPVQNHFANLLYFRLQTNTYYAYYHLRWETR